MKVTIALVAFLVVVGMVSFFSVKPHPLYTFRVAEGQALTEKVALDFSKRALALSRIGLDDLEPYAFDGTNFLARNTLVANQGYVLWHSRRSPFSFDYVVRLNLANGEITCTVGKTK